MNVLLYNIATSHRAVAVCEQAFMLTDTFPHLHFALHPMVHIPLIK